MARAGPADPAGHPPRRPARARPHLDRRPRQPVAVHRPRRGQRQLRRAGRQDRLHRPEEHRRAADGQGEDGGRAPPHHPPGEVLGERQEAAGDRQLQPVVHPLSAGRRDHRPGQGPRVPPRVHAGALRGLGQRPPGRLEHHPPALLRRPVPDLVPHRRRRRRRLPLPHPGHRGHAPGRPHHRRARPATTSPSATSPAGSPPTPTSWTRGTRRRCRRRSRRKWEEDPDLFERVYPMDLRPQAHDIIRTWLFSTVVKAHELFDELPFRHAAISGFVVDPDRKKLSKSKDNAEQGPVRAARAVRRRRACATGPAAAAPAATWPWTRGR